MLDHNILLSKFVHSGISCIANNLSISYLVGRTQYVDFDGIESDKEYLTTDVPKVMYLVSCLSNLHQVQY